MSFIAGYILGLEESGGGGGESATIESLTVTKNGIYLAKDADADGFDPVYVNVLYRFPEGTSGTDIADLVGDDTVVDETLEVYIKTDVTDTDTSRNITVGVYKSDGTLITYIGGGGYGKPATSNVKVDSIIVDPDTGAYDITISFDDFNGDHQIIHQTDKLNALVGFGASDHTIGVANN